MASTTSLLKSAAATRKKIRAQEDQIKQFEWENSAQTRAEFDEYQDYLNKRLQETSDVSDQLTYMSRQRAIFRSFTSNELQREQDRIRQGTGSIASKKAAIENLYNQAAANGDYNLAQNLVSQWYDLDIQEQNQLVSSYNAAQSLQKANNAATAKGFTDAAKAIESSLQNLANAYKRGGHALIDSATKQFLNDNLKQFKALGIELPENTVIDIGALTQAASEALLEYYGMAADALRVSDPERAADFEDKARQILDGRKTFNTPAGNMTYDQIKDFAAMPDAYRSSINEKGERVMIPATVARYEIRNGKVVPVVGDTSQRGELDKEKERLLKEMGFNVVGKDTRGYKVEITNDVRSWFPDIENLPDDVYLIPTENGFQFSLRDKNMREQLFTIASDRRGLGAVFREEMLAPGQGSHPIHLGGQYGFDQTANSRVTQVLNSAVTRQQQALAQRAQQPQTFVPPQTMAPTFTPPTGKQVANFLGISNPNALQAPIKQIVPANSANSGVFWRGADGQVWVKGHQGTNAAGAWDNNTTNYWSSRGFREIADPVANKPSGGTTIGGQPFSLTR